MTTLNRPVRRVTRDTYGYVRKARKLVVILDKGDLISIREQGRRTAHTARLYDVLWWMLRCEADRARMEKLRELKVRKSARLGGASSARSGTTALPSQWKGDRVIDMPIDFGFATPRPCEFAENNIVDWRLYRCAGRWKEQPVN